MKMARAAWALLAVGISTGDLFADTSNPHHLVSRAQRALTPPRLHAHEMLHRRYYDYGLRRGGLQGLSREPAGF